MNGHRRLPDPAVLTAMVGSAAVGAQYISGKAARDALFLTYFDASSLPTMIIETSLLAILLVVASGRWLKHVSAAAWVPAAFLLGAILLIAEWMLMRTRPGLASRLLYLQVSGLGPVLGSGFWLIASERFDPYTAKKRFGQIAGAGTLGGLLSGLVGIWVSETISAAALLPMLAAISIVCALLTSRLGKTIPGVARPAAAMRAARDTSRRPLGAKRAASVFRVLAEMPLLRLLATLVFLATTAALLMDQAFKSQVQADIGKGPELVSFFLWYSIAISVLTFVVQVGVTRLALQKLDLGVVASSPALAFLGGGIVTLLVPRLPSFVLTRGTESVLRGSVYRAAYEVFFTPVSTRDRRSIKSTIDVGVDRTADIFGATLIKVLHVIPQPRLASVLVACAMACSAVAFFVANRLKRAYEEAVAKLLADRALELDLSDVQDLTTQTTIFKVLPNVDESAKRARPDDVVDLRNRRAVPSDPIVQDIVTLNARDRAGIVRVLRNETGLARPLVPYVVALLARDDVADECMRALRAVAEERVGELVDMLIEPRQPFEVRRRLARVFSVCVSQRAADGLLLGLEDQRFEVRFQCGRSLLRVVEKNPRIRIDKQRIFDFVKDEVSVSRRVWESRQLIDDPDRDDDRAFLAELIRDRASEALAHVFTLLALVLPTEPLRMAFQGLHTNDQQMRGTALAYLEAVVPSDIRLLLWPFLDDRPPTAKPRASREDALEDLLRSHESIVLNLEMLKRLRKK